MLEFEVPEGLSPEEALVNYVETVQGVYNDHYAKRLSNLVPDLIQVEGGRKYIKVSHTHDGGNGQKAVHSFINSENGDILKPASWRAPAKHARGNIFSKINLSESGHVPYLR